jgi:hypothetical protein
MLWELDDPFLNLMNVSESFFLDQNIEYVSEFFPLDQIIDPEALLDFQILQLYICL